ncbi:MAG: pitrilysin family protein [bacterium]
MKIKEYPKFEQVVYTTTINNMNIVCIPSDKFNTTSVSLSIDYGATDIEFNYKGKDYKSNQGSAHFIEHKVFELEDGNDAFNLLSALGADANAYTTYDETAYMFSCSDNLYESFKIFLNFILTNTLNDKTINKEKGIILEELMMYLDKPHYVVQEKLMKLMYKDSYIKDSILGTTESINACDEASLSLIYDAFYNPKNMTLNVSGNFDINELEKFLEEELNKYKFDDYDTKKIYPKEKLTVEKQYEEVKVDSDVNYVALGIKLNPKINDNYLKNDYIAEVVNFMLFSKSTFKINDLIEKEVMFNNYSYYTIFNSNYCFTEFIATSDQQDLLIKELKSMILNFKENFIEEDFELFKKISYSNFIANLDDLESLCEEVSIANDENYDYFEKYETLDKITKEDILEFMKDITEENISIVKSI